jgi:hypothetical protein
MIIGNNNKNNFNNFNNNNINKNTNIFTKDIKDMSHSNPTSSKEMNDKAIAMLKSRLDNKLISFEEFQNAMKKIGK